MQNIYDIAEVQENNTRLEIGDIVDINGRRFYVKEINYEMSVGSPVELKYELESTEPDPITWWAQDTQVRIPMNAEIRQYLNSENLKPKKEKEISEETREQFRKLLE